jgi:hypothetical protein
MVGTLNQGKEGIVDPPAEIYLELRTKALDVDPAAIGLAPTEKLDRVYGVILDLGYPEGPATLVGFSDGTTSLYTSSGWGVIGGGEHEVVAEATLRWLTVAESMIDDFEKADHSQLPQVGDVAFTVLTYDGRYRAVTQESAVDEGTSPLTPLFAAGHDVISELRQIEQARE